MTVSGDLSRDTAVAWQAVPGALSYVVRWRRTDAQDWTGNARVTETSFAAREVPVDDTYFGVSAVAADGSESLVTFAGRKK